ncbi:MAG: metallophosphoesterase family protein [Candidatus Thorarchaeota archaeon]
MTIKIAVLGDTHAPSIDDIPDEIIKEIKNAEWVIHVGDFTSIQVINALIELKGKKFKGVYGNADPLDVRNKLNSREIIEISGKKIGFIHPTNGGPEDNLEMNIISDFKDSHLDILIYGHTHEAKLEQKNELLIVNPGKGYLEKNFFGPPTTIAILKIDNDMIQGTIKEIKS